MPQLFLILAITLYCIASALIAQQIRSKQAESSKAELGGLKTSFYLACLAVIAHGVYTALTSFEGMRLNLSLSSMLVVVSFITTIIFLLASTRMQIRRLGILVYPMTVISLTFSLLWPESNKIKAAANPLLSAHILVSLLAYAFIAIALIQALLHWYQERQIRARTQPAMLSALPPLQTMEQLWFRLVIFGFTCLSLTLISGALFSQIIFGHAFTFQHHTVLACLAWLVFLLMIVIRRKSGLRGGHAVLWTLGGFALIQLGYFGTKIVSESLQLS